MGNEKIEMIASDLFLTHIDDIFEGIDKGF